jgi:hypothetical protein
MNGVGPTKLTPATSADMGARVLSRNEGKATNRPDQRKRRRRHHEVARSVSDRGWDRVQRNAGQPGSQSTPGMRLAKRLGSRQTRLEENWPARRQGQIRRRSQPKAALRRSSGGGKMRCPGLPRGRRAQGGRGSLLPRDNLADSALQGRHVFIASKLKSRFDASGSWISSCGVRGTRRTAPTGCSGAPQRATVELAGGRQRKPMSRSLQV